jgi:hypothetical protein
MKRLQENKATFFKIINIVFVALAFWLRDSAGKTESTLLYTIAIIIFALLTIVAARFVTNSLFRIQWVRKFLARDEFIEGYWLVTTSDKSDYTLSQKAIIQVDFRPEAMEYRATVKRVNQGGGEVLSTSDTIYFDGKIFINKFDVSENGKSAPGIAFGRVSKSAVSSLFFDTWNGISININEKKFIPQKAKKITESEVSKAKEIAKQVKTDWVKVYLEEE